MYAARAALIISAVLMGMLLSTAARAASVVEVGACRNGYVQYGTIQEAVTAASAGATVLICPGNYPEQVMINKSLTLRGIETSVSGAAVISSPPGGIVANTTSLVTGNPLAAQVLVKNATDVNLHNLTVDGSNNGIADCASILIGVFYENSSGVISHLAALDQALAQGQSGCQSGLAIFAQSGNGGSSNLRVSNTVVQGYQKNGITGNEPGTIVTIVDNAVTGQGPTNGAAENGIQVGYGASGRVIRNIVSDNVWAPATISSPGNAATGILVFSSGDVTVHDNTVSDAQFGIALISDPASGAANGNEVSANRISAVHVFDGIEVCGNGNSIHDNTVSRADESGIHLDSKCVNPDSSATGKANRVRENEINSSCAGILVGSATSTSANFIAGNDFFNVGSTILNADLCPAAPSVSAQALADTAGKVPLVGQRASAIRP